MKVFVTGATGFIGSYLVKNLISNNHELMCLKRKDSDLYRVEDIKDELVWVDNDEGWVDRVKDFMPEAIFNLAWQGVSSRDRALWNVQLTNISMQQLLLDLALICGCKKFVGIGSQSEYGDFDTKVDESYLPNPKTAYAAVKVASLTILRSFCEIHGIDWYWFRVFPVFGPYEGNSWLIPTLIKSICDNMRLDLTSGEQCLPYLYVGECAKAIAAAIVADGKSGVYNICADNAMPLKSLVTKIRDMVNPDYILEFGSIPYRMGQSMRMEGDTSRLNMNIHRLYTADFEERLAETVTHYVNLSKGYNNRS